MMWFLLFVILFGIINYILYLRKKISASEKYEKIMPMGLLLNGYHEDDEEELYDDDKKEEAERKEKVFE